MSRPFALSTSALVLVVVAVAPVAGVAASRVPVLEAGLSGLALPDLLAQLPTPTLQGLPLAPAVGHEERVRGTPEPEVTPPPPRLTTPQVMLASPRAHPPRPVVPVIAPSPSPTAPVVPLDVLYPEPLPSPVFDVCRINDERLYDYGLSTSLIYEHVRPGTCHFEVVGTSDQGPPAPWTVNLAGPGGEPDLNHTFNERLWEATDAH